MAEKQYVGDVLVVGGGAAGLLTARAIGRRGLRVVVLESDSYGSAQSNHSHGYLHRGHIYSNPSPSLVQKLNQGADRWIEEMQQVHHKPEFPTASAVFVNPYSARTAQRAWHNAGLAFEREDCPPGLNRHTVPISFKTQEPTYNFTPWLNSTSASFPENVLTVHGRATSLVRKGQTIDSVKVSLLNATVDIQASHVVLAAGIGNLPLVSTATRYRGQALNRLSYMMVLKGSQLIPFSVVSPENEAYGLFMVSRRTADSTFWLVSNYLSFAGESDSSAKRTAWCTATLRLLERYTTALEVDDLEWGIYPAPKGELRVDRGKLDIHSVQSYAFENLHVASPSKLTLAPLLADAVCSRIMQSTYRHPNHQSDPDIRSIVSRIHTATERWQTVPLSSQATLRDFTRKHAKL